MLFRRVRDNVPVAKQRHYIKEWRKHRGLSQEQLAERLGVSRPQITKFEKNTRQPDLAELEVLAEILRCEPADLIMRDPTDPDGIWSIWDTLAPTERSQVVEIAKTFKKAV